MHELRLTAVSADGGHLVLSGHGDEEFALRVDDSLRAAIQGDRARLGQLDIQLESQLRPRDIQARIRAGETIDEVAAIAGMPHDKVERFAGPVIAEREHIAGRARQATIRRLAGDAPPETLEAAATGSASAHGADPQQLEWDAWRRDDGRWLVRFCWLGGDEESALFSFDPSGRTVLAEDANARVLAGEVPAEPTASVAPVEPVDDVDEEEMEPAPTGPAKLSVVGRPESEASEGDDGPRSRPLDLPNVAAAHPVRELVRDAEVEQPEPTDDDAAQHTTPIPVASRRPRRGQRYGRDDRRRREPELWSDESAEESNAAADDEATSERLQLSEIASRIETEEQPSLAPTAEGKAPADQPRKPSRGSSRSRRPSVPSWDEIMFGRRKTTET